MENAIPPRPKGRGFLAEKKMSGGHWDYSQYKVRDTLESVSYDTEIAKRFPRLSSVMKELSTTLYDIINDLDWDLSGDTIINNDTEFENNALNSIKNISQEKT
jgi:hypothetical protein